MRDARAVGVEDAPAGICLLVLMLASSVANATPTIGPLRVLTPQVERYGRFELAADITGDWQNPLDPE